jgi:NPCBM/NEW2 domain
MPSLPSSGRMRCTVTPSDALGAESRRYKPLVAPKVGGADQGGASRRGIRMRLVSAEYCAPCLRRTGFDLRAEADDTNALGYRRRWMVVAASGPKPSMTNGEEEPGGPLREKLSGGLGTLADISGLVAIGRSGSVAIIITCGLVAVTSALVLLLDQWHRRVGVRTVTAVALASVGMLLIGAVVGPHLPARTSTPSTAGAPAGSSPLTASPENSPTPSMMPPASTSDSSTTTPQEPPTTAPSAHRRMLAKLSPTGDPWLTGTWRMGGKPYANSLAATLTCTEDDQETLFDLSGSYQMLTTDVGISDEAAGYNRQGQVAFRIYADLNANGVAEPSEEVASKAVGYRQPTHIEASLQGASHIILRTSNPGDCLFVTAVWGNPQVA